MLLLLQTLVTAAYVAVVGRVWLLRRRAAQALRAPLLPADDQPPETAVGLPPTAEEFETYVDEGMDALDAYLSEGFAA